MQSIATQGFLKLGQTDVKVGRPPAPTLREGEGLLPLGVRPFGHFAAEGDALRGFARK